jgi:hypothetical protein
MPSLYSKISGVQGGLMFIYAIEFAPPMMGFDNEFNTIRVGLKWSKCLSVGDEVLLLDKPKSAVFGRAEVLRIEVGQLAEMSREHGALNHNQINLPADGAGERTIEALKRRYGPHIATDTKKVTVIYLKRIE